MTVRDPYREWSIDDRWKAGRDPDQRKDCDRYDADRDSGERAYENWRNGGDFRDPDPEGRFH